MNPYKITEPTCISFSGGRTSGYMLYKVLECGGGQLPSDAIVCFANTGKEDEATLKFVQACSDNWNVEIHWVEYRDNEPAFVRVDFETASSSGKPKRRRLQGPGSTSSKPPTVANAASHRGGTANTSTAPGHAARVCNTAIKTSTASVASNQTGVNSTPNIASGVSTSVTQGTANKFATKPTTDI